MAHTEWADLVGDRLGANRGLAYASWLLLLALIASSLAYPLTSLDSPSCVYVGKAMLEGAALYRDAWDVRAPGVFFTYGLAALVFGSSVLALRVFDLLWQLLTGWVVFQIAKVLGVPRATRAGALYLVLYFGQGFWNWGEPDGFLGLWTALCLLCTLRARESDRNVWWIAAALSAGVATVYKVPHGLVGLAALATALTTPGSGWRRLQRLALLATTVVLPSAACVAYFVSAGVLDEWFFAQFSAAPDYLRLIGQTVGMREFLVSAFRITLIPLYAVAAAVAWLALREDRSRLRTREILPIAVWLATAVLSFFFHGSFLPYHWVPFFAPVAVMGALAVAELDRARGHRGVALGLLAIFVAGLAASYAPHLAKSAAVIRTGDRGDRWEEVGRFVADRTMPDSKIFVWGNTPAIYLTADRRSASRFLTTAFLFLPETGERLRALLLSELIADPPAYVVVVWNGSITPGLPGGRESYERFPELWRLVELEFVLERAETHYSVFRRKTHPPL